jgi:hypothetical protein
MIDYRFSVPEDRHPGEALQVTFEVTDGQFWAVIDYARGGPLKVEAAEFVRDEPLAPTHDPP